MEMPSGVLVPGYAAAALHAVLREGIERRRERDQSVPAAVVTLAAELVRARTAEQERFRASEHARTDRGTSFTMDGMTTAQAAGRLGITERAVVGRLHRGTLDGYQPNGSRWVVYIDKEAS